METDKLEDQQSARTMLSILSELRMTARDVFGYISKLKETASTLDEDHQIDAMIAAMRNALPVEYASKLLHAYNEELSKP